jgi:2-polyprenyl-3-methyl-5-hydroxy-6-metoxy-1,4-benzoquinol methylase
MTTDNRRQPRPAVWARQMVEALPPPLRRAARAAIRRLLKLWGLRAVASARPGRFLVDTRSNDAFINDAYQLAFGRPADKSGTQFYGEMLRSGMGRDRVLLLIATSEESINRRLAESFAMQDLRQLRPDRYQEIRATNGHLVPVFEVEGPDDLDWLEKSILEYGYYEKPGIWTLGVDEDKRRMAELLALFSPERCLEIGCSSGAVLSCLHDRGVAAEGIEISAMAIRRADAEVRDRIHCGDLLSLDLPTAYDLVYGLDVFEHFNPNRMDAYLGRVATLTAVGGFVFVNVPTWGADPVYGTIWEPYLREWIDDVAANRLFRHIEVDDKGYPVMGHLVWAGSKWWEERFSAAGLRRELQVEKALHRRFDTPFEETPARKAFYVFSRDAEPDRVHQLVEACEQAP